MKYLSYIFALENSYGDAWKCFLKLSMIMFLLVMPKLHITCDECRPSMLCTTECIFMRCFCVFDNIINNVKLDI